MATKKVTLSNREETERFIGLYQGHECLWNVSSPLYARREQRQASYISIAALMGNGMTADQVPAKISTLRTYYSKELRRENASRKSGAGIEDLYSSQWEFFRLLDSFLHPQGHQKSNASNLKIDMMTRHFTFLILISYLTAVAVTAFPKRSIARLRERTGAKTVPISSQSKSLDVVAPKSDLRTAGFDRSVSTTMMIDDTFFPIAPTIDLDVLFPPKEKLTTTGPKSDYTTTTDTPPVRGNIAVTSTQEPTKTTSTKHNSYPTTQHTYTTIDLESNTSSTTTEATELNSANGRHQSSTAVNLENEHSTPDTYPPSTETLPMTSPPDNNTTNKNHTEPPNRDNVVLIMPTINLDLLFPVEEETTTGPSSDNITNASSENHNLTATDTPNDSSTKSPSQTPTETPLKEVSAKTTENGATTSSPQTIPTTTENVEKASPSQARPASIENAETTPTYSSNEESNMDMVTALPRQRIITARNGEGHDTDILDLRHTPATNDPPDPKMHKGRPTLSHKAEGSLPMMPTVKVPFYPAAINEGNTSPTDLEPTNPYPTTLHEGNASYMSADTPSRKNPRLSPDNKTRIRYFDRKRPITPIPITDEE